MLSGTGLIGVDGSAWYHPLRLSIDASAVADGNATPAQAILHVKAIHPGQRLPRRPDPVPGHRRPPRALPQAA
jgi:hypothetical protein